MHKMGHYNYNAEDIHILQGQEDMNQGATLLIL